MLSPDVPEFIPRGMRLQQEQERPLPSSERSFKARSEKADVGQKKEMHSFAHEAAHNESRGAFGSRRLGSFGRGNRGSHNSHVRDGNTIRNHDNWRERAQDTQQYSKQDISRSSNNIPAVDANKSRFEQGNKGSWRQKNEFQKIKENDGYRERKSLGKGKIHNIDIASTKNVEPQSLSYCKPGVSYGSILGGNCAWGVKADDQASRMVGGMASKDAEQWPGLPGSNQRSSPKGKTSNKDTIKTGNEKGDKMQEVEEKGMHKVENISREPQMLKEEREKTSEKVLNTPKNISKHVEANEPNLRPKKEGKFVDESVRAKESKDMYSPDNDSEWQVKRDRRKQAKPQEMSAKPNKLVEQKKQKNAGSATTVAKPIKPKAQVLPKGENDSKEQKNKFQAATTSVDKWDKKIQPSSTEQKVDNAVNEEDAAKILARKLKKKEGKIKKREQKAREAQDRLNKDSKISMITKAFLESTYSSSTRSAWSSASGGGPSLFENEPSLAEQRSMSTRKNLTRKKPPTTDSFIKSEVKKDSNEREKSQPSNTTNTTSGDPTSAISSYSGILLRSPKKVVQEKNIVEKKQSNEVKDPAAQKKKVKTKDRIELDIMSAALHAKKMKDKARRDRDLNPGLDRSRKNTADVRTVFKGSKTAYIGNLRATGSTTTSTLYRGFQRQGKKRLSPLKKRMKKAKIQEAEALLAIVREAKKNQEKLIQESISEELQKLSLSSCGGEDGSQGVEKEIEIDGIQIERELTELTNKSQKGLSERVEVDLPTGEIISEGIDSTEEKAVDITTGQNNSPVLESPNVEIVEVPDKDLEVKAEDKQVVTSTESTNLTNAQLKKVIKEIKSYDVSPVKVGNMLANLGDPELAKRCSSLAEEIKILASPVHKLSFREYCDHVITPEVDEAVKQMVTMLVKFQERQYQRDPIKAKMRKRYVCGLKEATKLMTKMSCIIVAPDIERSRGPGLLDEVVTKMLNRARENGVPIIFALSARKLGRLCHKHVQVSCIGVINYQGAQEVFNQMMELVPAAKAKYQSLVNTGLCTVPMGTDGLSDDEIEN